MSSLSCALSAQSPSLLHSIADRWSQGIRQQLCCGGRSSRCQELPQSACQFAGSPVASERTLHAIGQTVQALCCTAAAQSMGQRAGDVSLMCSDGSQVPAAAGMPALVAGICREHRVRLWPNQWRHACRRFVDMHAQRECACMVDEPGGGAACMAGGPPADSPCVRCGLRVRMLAVLWRHMEVGHCSARTLSRSALQAHGFQLTCLPPVCRAVVCRARCRLRMPQPHNTSFPTL